MEDVDFIETHGTGTPLGDAVECNALKQVFDGIQNKIGLGAVKTSIGHLELASGIASLVKVLLALDYAIYPRNMNFKNANGNLRLEDSNLYLVNQNISWKPKHDKLRMAGVSSFGFGGVNAHVLIEEYRASYDCEDGQNEKILTFSAMNDIALL